MLHILFTISNVGPFCDVHGFGPIWQSTQIKIGVTPSVDTKSQHGDAYDVHYKSGFDLQRYNHNLYKSMLKYKRKMIQTIAEINFIMKKETLLNFVYFLCRLRFEV